jgi:hypothetical protein
LKKKTQLKLAYEAKLLIKSKIDWHEKLNEEDFQTMIFMIRSLRDTSMNKNTGLNVEKLNCY